LRHGDLHCYAMNWKERISCHRFRWHATHPQERFYNSRQSYVLSTKRIEIHQSQPLVWPSDLLYVMQAGCDWWIRYDMSITRKTDGNFGNVSAGVLFSKVANQRKRW